MRLLFGFSLRGLVLVSMNVVACGWGAWSGLAQPLPWPDANPVMRLGSPTTRAHRAHPHRKARRHSARAKQTLQRAAKPTELKAVAPDSVTAVQAPSAVPLPTSRAITAPDTEQASGETAESDIAAAMMPSGEPATAAQSTDQSKPTADQAAAEMVAASQDESSTKPALPKTADSAQAATPADLPSLPAPAAVPVPEKSPAAKAESGDTITLVAPASNSGESFPSGQSNVTKPAKTSDPEPSATETTPVPAPSPADQADAAMARSGLGTAPRNNAAPQEREARNQADKQPAEKGHTGSNVSAENPVNAVPSSAGSTDAGTHISDPGAAATLPIADIPVPEKRPDTPTADALTSAKPGEAGMPAKAEAPNSTAILKANVPDVTPEAMVAAAAAIESAKSCETELKKRGVDFTIGESIAEGECGVLRPIELKTLSSGVTITPTTFLLCRTALALDQWMADVVVPAAKSNFTGDTIKAFEHTSTYVCRKRASERGISEHARGSAIDVGGFAFKSGRHVEIGFQKKDSAEEKFQHAIREAACGPFKTVLGPGTDPDHAAHFHLDMAARRNGATYCK